MGEMEVTGALRKWLILGGAGGGNRTPTGLPLLDFESSASTSSTTPALSKINSLNSLPKSMEAGFRLDCDCSPVWSFWLTQPAWQREF